MFITFEGIEGCGKTTQLKLLAETLKQQGIPVSMTREPGGCPIADKIRSILLDADHSAMISLTELFLYAAARSQHLNDIVRPALSAGSTVLCDRFTDATIAYQGYGRNIDIGLIQQLNKLASNGIAPNLTILMDCPVEVGLQRACARISNTIGAKEERFELESLPFHEAVRSGYLALAHNDPDRFVIINAELPVPEIADQIATIVLNRLEQHRAV